MLPLLSSLTFHICTPFERIAFHQRYHYLSINSVSTNGLTLYIPLRESFSTDSGVYGNQIQGIMSDHWSPVIQTATFIGFGIKIPAYSGQTGWMSGLRHQVVQTVSMIRSGELWVRILLISSDYPTILPGLGRYPGRFV